MRFYGLAVGAFALLCTILPAADASATPVVPLSYAFDQPTGSGTWVYNDSTGTELIDGTLGVAGYGVNAAAPWVGWLFTPVVNIDFDFGTTTHIGTVSVGTTQDNPTDVTLPSLSIYSSANGSTWTLRGNLVVPPSSANDHGVLDTGPHTFLDVTGLAINDRYVRVAASANGPWTFIDEVRFDTAVPEPASLALLGGALAAFAGLRRRRDS